MIITTIDMKNITLTSEQTSRYKKYRAELPLKLLATFDAGRMLYEINSEELYKIDGYGNFKMFCQDILKVSGAHAYKLITAYETSQKSPMRDSIKSDRQRLALKNVPIEDHIEVVTEAEKSGKITGKSLAAAAVAVAAKKPAGTVNPTPPVVKDEKGREIPQAIMLIWNRRPEVRQLMDAISEVKCHIKEALERGDVLYAEIDNGLVADLETAYATIKCALPYTVCPSCQGRDFKNCLLCGKRGFISKYKYDTAVTTEIKKQVDAAIAAKAKK